MGADRMLLTKADFHNLPFPEFDALSDIAKASIRDLAGQLQHNVLKPWRQIDELVFGLYGLDEEAVQVARDTLFSAAPYRRAGKAAFERTMRVNRADFVNTLKEELQPYFDVCGEQVTVEEAAFQPDSWREPWFFLAVAHAGARLNVNANLMRKVMEAANERGASRIVAPAAGKRGLLIGVLNQRRWWTVTRARLCAQHIIRNHLDAFGLPEDA